MKRYYLLILCLWLILPRAYAQDNTIPFETLSLEKVFQKAKKTKKLIFMDCYTRWCDGCKLMDKNVFPQEDVIRFFQSNFINVRMDMGDGEGAKLAEKYDIVSFPALLFLNRKGDIVHLAIGYRTAEQLIHEGKRAINPQLCLAGMTKRFNKGERNPEFLADYVTVLRSANKPECKDVALLYIESTGLEKRFEAGERDIAFMEQYASVLEIARLQDHLLKFVPEYLALLPVEKMLTERNWEWLCYYASNRCTTAVCKVAESPLRFMEIAGGIENVNRIVREALRQEMYQYLRVLYDRQYEINEEKFDTFLQYLHQVNSPVAPECIIQLNTLKSVRRGDYAGVFDCMEKALKYNVFVIGSKDSYFLDFLKELKKCKETKWINEGIRMIDRCLAEGVSTERKDAWIKLKNQLTQTLETLNK